MAKQPMVVKQPNRSPAKINTPTSFVQSIAMVELEGGFGVSSPYVQFVHKLAKNYQKLCKQIKGIADDTIALVYPGNELPIELNPLRFTPFAFYQYWAVLNAQGEPTKVFWKLEDATAEAKEHVDSVCLVYTDDRVVEARILWKTTKIKAMRTADAAVKEASDDVEWGNKGTEYKNTLFLDQPFYRFVAEVELARKVSKSGQASGLPYYLATSTIAPTTNTEWKKIIELFETDSYEKDHAALMSDYEARRKFLESKV